MGRANANGWPKFGECSTQISVRHDSVADSIAKAAGPRLSSGGLYRNVLTEAQECERPDRSGGQEGLGGRSRRTARCALPKKSPRSTAAMGQLPSASKTLLTGNVTPFPDVKLDPIRGE